MSQLEALNEALKSRFASADFPAFSAMSPGFIALEVKTAYSTMWPHPSPARPIA